MSRPRRCVWPSVCVPQPEPLLCFFQIFTTVDPKRLKAQLQRSRRIRGSREARRSVVGRPALALEDPLETETWKGHIPAEYHAISVGFFEERPSGRFGWLNARTGTWAACWTSSAWHDSVRSCAAPRAGCVEAPVGDGGRRLGSGATPCLLTILAFFMVLRCCFSGPSESSLNAVFARRGFRLVGYSVSV